MTDEELIALADRLNKLCDIADMGRGPDPTSTIRIAAAAIRKLVAERGK